MDRLRELREAAYPAAVAPDVDYVAPVEQPVQERGGRAGPARLGTVQEGQASHRPIGEAVKRRDTPPLEETSRSPVLEASDHLIRPYAPLREP